MKIIIFLACALAFLLLVTISTTESKLPRNECTIIKNPMNIPPVGVVSANPERAKLIAQKYFDTYYTHTDFRGFQVYVGTYKGIPMFAANTGLGSAAAAFLVEELIAYDAQVIIRLGTNDYNVTESDTDKVFIVRECHGLVGLMRDYGYEAREWGTGLPSDPSLVQSLIKNAANMDGIRAVPSIGYNIDAFYSFFDPKNVAHDPRAIESMINHYQRDLNATVRDMETCAVLLLGQVHKVRTAAVLQAVVKHGNQHEGTGTTGIPLVLSTLASEHQQLMRRKQRGRN